MSFFPAMGHVIRDYPFTTAAVAFGAAVCTCSTMFCLFPDTVKETSAKVKQVFSKLCFRLDLNHGNEPVNELWMRCEFPERRDQTTIA